MNGVVVKGEGIARPLGSKCVELVSLKVCRCKDLNFKSWFKMQISTPWWTFHMEIGIEFERDSDQKWNVSNTISFQQYQPSSTWPILTKFIPKYSREKVCAGFWFRLMVCNRADLNRKTFTSKSAKLDELYLDKEIYSLKMFCKWAKYLYKYVENILQRQIKKTILFKCVIEQVKILCFPTSGQSLIFPGGSRGRALWREEALENSVFLWVLK